VPQPGRAATKRANVNRTLGLAPGGATLANEENYLIEKLSTSLGVVQWKPGVRMTPRHDKNDQEVPLLGVGSPAA